MKEYFMFYKFFGTEVCESFCVRAKDERAAKDLLWDFISGEEIFEEGRAFNYGVELFNDNNSAHHIALVNQEGEWYYA